MYFSNSLKCKPIIPWIFKLGGLILIVQIETFWGVKGAGVDNYAQATGAMRAVLGRVLTLVMKRSPFSESGKSKF